MYYYINSITYYFELCISIAIRSYSYSMHYRGLLIHTPGFAYEDTIAATTVLAMVL